MKNVRLIRLTLENFKGVGSFTLDAQGGSVTVTGTNGTGKTTLFDAYNWLLFGKDSAGHSDNSFDVKPYNGENPVISVTGMFEVSDDGIITLRRQLTEKTVRQRGTDESTVKNDYSFFVDDVPKTKTQYDAVISELCPSEKFRMVSDPDYFAGKMKWDSRRKLLSELFGSLDEHALLKSDEKWKPLLDAADGKSVADCRALAAAERKKVKAELDSLPGRIEEASKAIPEEAGEFDPLELAEAEKKLSDAEDNLKAAASGTLIAELKQQIAEEKAALAQAQTKYYSGFDDSAVLTEKANAERAVFQAQSKASSIDKQIRDAQEWRERAMQRRSALGNTWRELNALAFDRNAETCPCCGQTLPTDKIEQLRNDFNADKARRLEENISAGTKLKQELEDNAAKIEELTIELEKVKAAQTRAEAELEAAKARLISPPDYKFTSEYAERTSVISHLEYQLASEKENISKREAELSGEVQRCKIAFSQLREKAASIALAEKQKKRVAELKAQARGLGKSAAELDRLLDLAAQFEQYKLTAIEGSINDRFRCAKFKLFEKQLNGGYSECCEVVVDDAPYSTNLNPGKKINAGLDIIRTLSEAVGFSAPVWIDNSESYVTLDDIGAQIIALRVDASAQALTINHEEK